MNRRAFLRLSAGAAGVVLLDGCSTSKSELVDPAGAEVQAAQSRRPAGPVRSFTLTAKPTTVDLGGVHVATWTYGDALPGDALRVRKGEVLEARLINRLPTDTSVHWHGIALRNDMDGVPGTTQQPIPAGGEFTYRFTADVPGTYWFHPHTGLQLERGLYAPLIVEDPADGDTYDDEWVVVLDDWLDGVAGTTPEAVYDGLRTAMSHGGADTHGMDMSGMDMSGMDMGSSAPPTASAAPSASRSPGSGPVAGMLMGATSALLGGDAGDVAYPHYLINGRVSTAPASFAGVPGRRVRMRIINAGGDTAFRVALGGHRMKVTHTDGFPVAPVTTDALLIGMGERYDVEVTLADGVFPLVALAEGKDRTALAVVRTARGTAPAADVRPGELTRSVLRYDQLTAAEGFSLAPREVDREHRLELTGAMGAYDWAINGRPFDAGDPLLVEEGQRVRLTITNATAMWHPMHLHGHTFQLNSSGPRKDTAAVLPRQTITADFDADNPGQWMVHCHNAYHQAAGMMRALAYSG
ncbi:MAG TPA: multicopper oxidase family protein [Sporichthya sp.]|nr:multicopper oxidase family protein [Sporichthya sp.]